jgi:hypothetical protein
MQAALTAAKLVMVQTFYTKLPSIWYKFKSRQSQDYSKKLLISAYKNYCPPGSDAVWQTVTKHSRKKLPLPSLSWQKMRPPVEMLVF